MAIPTIQMSVDDWDKVQDNPIQRDTELHSKKLLRGIDGFSETHQKVAAAQLPDGKLIKLDGHTRALLWSQGKLKKPDSLSVDIYHVQTVDDVMRLYRHFDSQVSAENGVDKKRGAFRMVGFDPKSSLLRNGGLSSAISVAEGTLGNTGFDIYQAVTRWENEIRLIDEQGFTHNLVSAGVFAAMLLTFRKHGTGAIEFWSRYNEKDGVKNGKTMDGVHALEVFITTKHMRKQIGGYNNVMEIAEKSLACFEGFKSGYFYSGKNQIKRLSLKKYRSSLGI